ncbi:MAG: Flp pilus assembly complex ATPase component TadA [Anaerolineaceae bacterium]|nr:Flp pilus assembly complex ATPase component TadA [Anaerolineaceae bacterium]
MSDTNDSENTETDFPSSDDQQHDASHEMPPGQEPHFVTTERGRVVSMAGLAERIVEEFNIEFDEASQALIEADSEAKRRSLVREVADYVMGVESVQLSLSEKARILQYAYSEIFGYGPLDLLFADPKVTTISLENRQGIAVRFGPGAELVPQNNMFEDWHHVRRTIKRLLKDAGAEIRSDIPIVEAGLRINGRAVNVNVVSPPFSADVMADIRVHPSGVIPLTAWVAHGMMNEVAADFLRRLAQSAYGFAIVGETESGKTALMSTMLSEANLGSELHSVEWAGELLLPEGAHGSKVAWPIGDNPGITFAQRIAEALESQPGAIVLDEVRADEAEAVAPLLSYEHNLRQMWVVRGASDSKRIRSGLSMLARRADSAMSEAMVTRLYERLPFVIVLKRRRDRIELVEIAEWQPSADESGYYDYVPLVAKGWEGLERTEKELCNQL